MSIYVSPGNTKTGEIPSFSLPAGKSCVPGVPCFKDGCYGRRTECFRGHVLASRQRNYVAVQEDMNSTFESIHGYLLYTRPSYFRAAVSGDMWLGSAQKSQRYLYHWMSLAKQHSDIKFLMFTKCYELDYSLTPSNLSVIYSAWPRYPMPAELPDGVAGTAYMQDGTETRVPDDALECPGKCDTCGACWDIRKTKSRATVFHKH